MTSWTLAVVVQEVVRVVGEERAPRPLGARRAGRVAPVGGLTRAAARWALRATGRHAPRALLAGAAAAGALALAGRVVGSSRALGSRRERRALPAGGRELPPANRARG